MSLPQSRPCEALIRLDDMHACYGHVEALHSVSMSVNAGSIVSVLGPNGAGKSTLLAAAMGLIPARGQVFFAGVDLHQCTVEDRVALGLCLVPERRELFGDLTIQDNLRLGAYTRGMQGSAFRRSLDSVYARFPRLGERRRQLANTLSGGERQMLALGRALMATPRALLLDEPSLGLAPLIVKEMLTNLSDLCKQGMTILLIEQNARAALQISAYGYVLEAGRIAFEGDASKLAEDPRLQHTYLGGGAEDTSDD